ncbi:MAG: hypothetical protein WAW85_07925 [Gordonia sp. (in: high G+C Gram-positive bacteria)]|uniref:hypothetical protein n=1 Tax=Gordonia sp. (in: high G+C Gram-positive bacteria) TaxID=84139 RepID=UPI003BB49BA1
MMKIRKAIAGAALAVAATGSIMGAQAITAGDAVAAPTAKYQGNGYYKVGPFPSKAKCNSHRAGSKSRYNLSRSACYAGGIGWYYTGRAGA